MGCLSNVLVHFECTSTFLKEAQEVSNLEVTLTKHLGRKKLPLDVLLENDSRTLLRGYSPESLQDLFFKIHEFGCELEKVLEIEGEVKEILGTKLENKTVWFY